MLLDHLGSALLFLSLVQRRGISQLYIKTTLLRMSSAYYACAQQPSPVVQAIAAARKTIEKHIAKVSVEAARKHTGPMPGEQDISVGDEVHTHRKN